MMNREPYLLTDLSRRWYLYDMDAGGKPLMTGIPDRARRFHSLQAAEAAADRLAEKGETMEPILLERARETWNDTPSGIT